MTADKTNAAIKQATKKKQTVLTAHLYEIVAEDKTAGTFTFKEVPLPPLSKTGNTKTEKIINGITEATDSGDDSFNNKDFAILYSNHEFVAIREQSKSVSKKRS